MYCLSVRCLDLWPNCLFPCVNTFDEILCESAKRVQLQVEKVHFKVSGSESRVNANLVIVFSLSCSPEKCKNNDLKMTTFDQAENVFKNRYHILFLCASSISLPWLMSRILNPAASSIWELLKTANYKLIRKQMILKDLFYVSVSIQKWHFASKSKKP